MTRRARVGAIVVAATCALVLPAGAWAHAALLRTTPAASGVLAGAPAQVTLAYTEAVEARFAIVSVTDQDGRRVTDGVPRTAPSDPSTVVVPLRRIPAGWYLVYWRVVSADGHPVRGAFTFAVGPNPGPAPQFVVPPVSETAATTGLVTARWAMFSSVLAAIGLLALRLAIARPVVRRVQGTRLRSLTVAFGVAAAVGLVAIPVYVLLATAQFALRSFFALGDLVPLVRASAFGRGYVGLWICFGLFAGAAAVALWVDRPERAQRSLAELLASTGALIAAAATLLVPGVAGHAAQTSPRGLALTLDWLHLGSAALWLGGLLGLVVLWGSFPAGVRVAGLGVCVPRFSKVAFGSVLVLLATGTWASILHLPTLGSLWGTSYGQVIVLKVALLGVAVALGAVNLLHTKPRLHAAARPALGTPAASLLRRLVSAEGGLVAAAVLAAALLSSLAPPAKALADIGRAAATVGPGRVAQVVERDGYRFELTIAPNRAAVPNAFSVAVTRGGKPVGGAEVTAGFAMLDMEMGRQRYRLDETRPGVYTRTSPALVMVGRWGVSLEVVPRGKPPVGLVIVDHAAG